MKHKITAFLALAGLTAFGEAQIDRVIVRQQWPWSTDVRVEYEINGVTDPVNVGVEAFDGETPLDATALKANAKGDLHGIAENGTYAFTIDAIKAFGNLGKRIENFKVKLSLSAAPANINEVIYKVFDLENGTVKDISRADFFDGKCGDYTTEYTDFGTDFVSSVDDVLIWTALTNDPAYATTKLVMRKIPAASVVWKMGSPTTETGYVTGREYEHNVKLTQNFWIGVFEVTQPQFARFADNRASYYANAACSATRPAENMRYDHIRGTIAGAKWGSNYTLDVARLVDEGSFLDALRKKFGGAYQFDLPTEAQWEFACRAMCYTAYYNGKTVDYNEIMRLARSAYNGGRTAAGGLPVAGCADNEATARVGSYAPNPYGLYDMLGNVAEWCLDSWVLDLRSADDPVVDPRGGAAGNQRVKRGSNFAAYYNKGDLRAGQRAYQNHDAVDQGTGFRLCLTEGE